MMDTVIIRLKRPSGKGRRMPSAALNDALVSLAETAEVQPLLCAATEEGKALAIDMFQSREGYPLLISFAKVRV